MLGRMADFSSAVVLRNVSNVSESVLASLRRNLQTVMAMSAPETLAKNPLNSSKKFFGRDPETALYQAKNGSFPGNPSEF
jgi:hypothetical protein